MKSAHTLAALVLAAVPAAAFADPPTGSRLGSHTRPGPALTERDQAKGAKDLANCLYNRKTAMARDALLSPSKAAADAATGRLMGDVTCFNLTFANDMVQERHVKFPHDIMRGMLAEAALGRFRGEAEALPPLPLQQVYHRDWYSVTGRHVSVDEMGACIADTNPAGILDLIRTEPASKEEATAFSGLSDNLGKCLRAGTRLQASRQALRAALADALFQRVSRPAPALETVAEAAKK